MNSHSQDIQISLANINSQIQKDEPDASSEVHVQRQEDYSEKGHSESFSALNTKLL